MRLVVVFIVIVPLVLQIADSINPIVESPSFFVTIITDEVFTPGILKNVSVEAPGPVEADHVNIPL